MDNISFKSSDKKVEIKSDSGLDITFRPYNLLKEIFGQGSQKIIDGLIEAGWKIALMDFAKWHKEIFSGKSPIDIPTIEQKYKERDLVPEILALACYNRDLLFLHTDWETIELSPDEVKAERASYDFWKYNPLYGYKSAEERKGEIKNTASSTESDIKSLKKEIIQPQNTTKQVQNTEKKPIVIPKHGQKFQNPNMNVSESINLQPTVEIAEDGFPTWFTEAMRITAKAMYSGDGREAINWLSNISRAKGSLDVFGVQEIAIWLQQAIKEG